MGGCLSFWRVVLRSKLGFEGASEKFLLREGRKQLLQLWFINDIQKKNKKEEIICLDYQNPNISIFQSAQSQSTRQVLRSIQIGLVRSQHVAMILLDLNIMKQGKQHSAEQLYRLSELRQKQTKVEQYGELVRLLQSQVELLKKAAQQVEDVLAVYWKAVNNIAKCVDVGTQWKEVKSQDIQKLAIWLSSVEKSIESVVKDRLEGAVQTVEIERIVEVQRPVFIEKRVEVYRPIVREVEKEVVKEVIKYVEKPVFVEKIVQKAVYVGGNSHMKCAKCASIM